MVGAKQSVGQPRRSTWRARPGRGPPTSPTCRRASSTPWSRATTRTSPRGRPTRSRPACAFSKPIFSHLGTREPFRAKAVPYFDSTDHLVFNDSWVGVPGTTLTNWPDENIHSSGDDLWQIDPTQLKRNAFIVAAQRLVARRRRPTPTSRCSPRSSRRAAPSGSAGTWRRPRPGSRPATGPEDDRRRAAANLLDVALAKEIAAVESVARRRSAGADPADAAVANGTAMLRNVALALRQRLGDPPDGPDSDARPPRAAHAPAGRAVARRLDGARAQGRREAHGRAPGKGRREEQARGAPEGGQGGRANRRRPPTSRTARRRSRR